MSTIFKFLKEYDKYAYKWATNMERTLYTEPLGSLAYGGRFIESIRTALYQKHYKEMKKYNRNLSKTDSDNKINSISFKQEDLSKHISDLYHAKIIKSTDSYKIIHAYNIRHKLHENEDIDDIESDRKAALELYKEVFEIAIWFCKHMDPTFDGEPIEFKYPSTEEAQETIPDVDIVKIFNDCVICGKENKSHNRNICPECYRKIRLASDLEDLIDLLDKENRFTKEFLKKHSYDRYEIDYIIHFLREFDLRSRETKGEIYLKDSNTLYDFIDETKSYEEMERILLAFYNELIGADDIDCSENSFYKMGEMGDESYHQFYILIITKKIKNYLNLKSKNYSHACERSGVNISEISNWYERKVKKIIKSNYKRDLDISFNQMSRILMGKWIEFRENKEKKEFIKEKLMLSDTVLDFWLDDNLRLNNKYPYIRKFIFKNREIEMMLFVEGLSSGLNKSDAIEFADTSLEFVDKNFDLNNENTLIRKWRLGKQENNEESFKSYKNIYFHNRTKEFLECLKGDTIDNSLLGSLLDKRDFNKWYNAGKREFFKHNCNVENDMFKFYIKTTRTLMDNWLEERRKGHKKQESCRNIGLYSESLEEWFEFERDMPDDFTTNPKYRIFRKFYNESNEVNMDLIIEAIERGENKQRISKSTDISLDEIEVMYAVGRYFYITEGLTIENPEDFKNYRDLFRDMDDESIEGYKNEMASFYDTLEDNNRNKFIEFFLKYDELYDSKRIDEFLVLCRRKGNVPKVLKNHELSEENINEMYEKGKQGDAEYREFYENFLEAKIEIYIAKIASKEKKSNAMRDSGLTKEEVEENKNRIERTKLTFDMIYVLKQQNKGKKLDKICNKTTFSMKDVFNWYLKGKELMDEKGEYIKKEDMFENDSIDVYAEFREIEPEDDSLDEHYMKFYNFYNEFHVLPNVEILSRNYTENKRLLRHILKDIKVTQKEYNFWMDLGLIENKREMELDNDMESNSEKIKYMKKKMTR